MLHAQPHKRRIVVIGGGISGLACAHALVTQSAERGVETDVRLFEATEHLGGVIRTVRRDGFLLEQGPDCFLSIKPAGLALCGKLGISDRLIGTSTAHRRSFVVYRGRLRPLPKGLYLLAPTSLWSLATAPILSWRGKLRVSLDLFIPRRTDSGDESLAEFVTRRLGREALDRIAQPMAAGIYTADPAKLSLQATFPQFVEMEREHGSIIRALARRRKQRAASGEHQASGPRYGLFVSFAGGMQTLSDAIVAGLPSGCIRRGTAVSRLVLDRESGERESGSWRIETACGDAARADAVCLAVSAPAADRMLKDVQPELAAELGAIEYASSVVINLAYRREDVAHPLDGMGMVVPAIEGRNLLACTFSHAKFEGRAPQGFVLLRAFLGGALRPELNEKEDDELVRMAHADLSELLGIRAEPQWTQLRRHPGAMPQYGVGHLDRAAKIEKLAGEVPGLGLAGNAYGGIGIPDCIQRAQAAASLLLDGMQRTSG